MNFYLKIVIVYLLFMGQNLFARQLTDAQLTPSQKQTLEALTQDNPEIDYPKKGIKGFYNYYMGKESIGISEAYKNPIPIVDISLFSTLPILKMLEVHRCHVVDFNCFAKNSNLVELYINDCRYSFILSSIFKIKN
mgnify:CR=1 FL=1